MVQITAPNEMVLRFQFQVRMRDFISKMHIAVPTMLFDPIVHIFDQEEYSTRKVIRDGSFVQLLRTVPVNVAINTAETQFAMHALLSLQVGDTLVLDQRQEAPVILSVAGKNKFHAKARLDSTHKAFVITGYMRPRREEPVNGSANE
jgi:flagellar motor switch protein FliM